MMAQHSASRALILSEAIREIRIFFSLKKTPAGGSPKPEVKGAANNECGAYKMVRAYGLGSQAKTDTVLAYVIHKANQTLGGTVGSAGGARAQSAPAWAALETCGQLREQI